MYLTTDEKSRKPFRGQESREPTSRKPQPRKSPWKLCWIQIHSHSDPRAPGLSGTWHAALSLFPLFHKVCASHSSLLCHLCHMVVTISRNSITAKSRVWSSESFDMCSIIMSLVGSCRRRGRVNFYFWNLHATIKSVSSRSACLYGCTIWGFVCIAPRHLCHAVLTFFVLVPGRGWLRWLLGENQEVRAIALPSARVIFAGDSPCTIKTKPVTYLYLFFIFNVQVSNLEPYTLKTHIPLLSCIVITIDHGNLNACIHIFSRAKMPASTERKKPNVCTKPS